MPQPSISSLSFFFNDTATTEIYPLSLHDALPIWIRRRSSGPARHGERTDLALVVAVARDAVAERLCGLADDHGAIRAVAGSRLRDVEPRAARRGHVRGDRDVLPDLEESRPPAARSRHYSRGICGGLVVARGGNRGRPAAPARRYLRSERHGGSDGGRGHAGVGLDQSYARHPTP